MGEEGIERVAKKPRVMVEEASLAILKASYLNHFSEYSRTKKQVSQKLPGKVWKSVYQDYILEMEKIALHQSTDFVPEALPSMRTLQDALRASISIEGRLTSGATCYQIESVKNEGFRRDSTANDNPALSDVNNLIAAEIGERLESASLSSTSDRTTSTHRTAGRLESMAHAPAANGLETVIAAISDTGKAVVDILKAHVALSSQKLKLLGADLVLKGEAHAADMRTKQLQLLIILRDEGVISPEEFRLKAKAVADA